MNSVINMQGLNLRNVLLITISCSIYETKVLNSININYNIKQIYLHIDIISLILHVIQIIKIN